jgi:hypothetical protein
VFDDRANKLLATTGDDQIYKRVHLQKLKDGASIGERDHLQGLVWNTRCGSGFREQFPQCQVGVDGF